MRFLVAMVFMLSAGIASAVYSPAAFDRSHAAWNRLLNAHVRWNAAGTGTTVDYDGFSRDRVALNRYLADASAVGIAQFGHWPRPERHAFLINVYNAATVQLVLTRYPDLESIRDLGGLFRSPWKLKVLPLFGRERSLDEIEHTLLRGAADYDEPRIHFAVNCASIGCPALRPEVYLAARLDAQLDDQTRRFLRDRTRNRYEARSIGLQVSPIFDWYAGDFDAHAGGVRAFLARYPAELGLDAAASQRLRAERTPVEFGVYDWRLNRSVP